MRSSLVLHLGIALLTLMGYAQLSGTYTIGNSGNYLNLTAAMNALNSQGINGNVRFEILPDYAGEPSGTVTINVAQFGPYAGMGLYNVTLTVHSSVTSPITIITSPNTGLASRFVFRLTGVDNFTIDGGPNRLLRFTTGAPSSSTGIIGLISDNTYHPNPCKRITIRNIEIDGADKSQTRVGIYLGQQSTFPGAANVSGNDNNVIENCRIYGVQEGIILHGHSSRDKNNQIIGCEIGHPSLTFSWGGSTRSSGILAIAQENLLIERNTIFNASSSSSYGYTGIAVGYGPQSTGAATPCKNVHIRRNWIYKIAYTGSGGWDAFGIRVNVGSLTNSQTYIYNNFIADIRTDGYSPPASTWNAYGILLAGSSNANAGIYVYHNSIHLYGSVSATATNSNPSCLAIGSGITGGVHVRNNIFQNTQTPGAASNTRRTIAIAYGGTNPNVFSELDNNAYYVDNANGSQYAFIGALGTNVYATLTAWQGAVGSTREQNSIQLTSPAPFVSNDSLHIPNGTSTPIEGGGSLISSPIAIITDIDNDPRPDGSPNPDIGADEFVAVIPPCPTAISADQITASPTTLPVGTGSITVSVNNPANVTTPAYWLASINGGPWNVIAAYTGPSYVYTPASAGTYEFRLVAIVAPYHSSCTGLQNDSSNIVSVSVVCPTALSADQISVNPTTLIQTQTVTFSVNNPGNVTLPAQWEISTAGPSGPWSVLAPYTGAPYTYAPLQGNYWVQLRALPPAGCSNTPVSSNVESFTVLPPPGASINDPIDLTPQDPTRTDTSFTNNMTGYPDNYTGPNDRNAPAVFHRYILRSCLDSISISTCNITGFASPVNDTYIHVLTMAAARGTGQCGISNDDATGCGLRSQVIASYPPGFVCNSHPVASTSNPRGNLPLAAGDTLIIVVQKYTATSSGSEYRLEITEYPYDPSSAPTLPQPPYFGFDTSRVCWTGGVVRDTLNTGITTPGIQHNWYINGTQVSGVTGNTLVAQFNAPGIYTVVAELTSAQSSACTPPALAPRDTVYVVVDSLPGTNIEVDGSEYFPGSFANVSGGGNVCVTYSPTLVSSSFSYSWVINGSAYTGPGPHTECYTGSGTDTVVLVVQNGACTEVDTVYVIVDLSTGLSGVMGGLRVYPVPAQEAVYVVWPADGPGRLWIEDLRGQRVYEAEAMLSAGAFYRIPRQNIAAGLYLLRLSQGSRQYLQRIAFE